MDSGSSYEKDTELFLDLGSACWELLTESHGLGESLLSLTSIGLMISLFALGNFFDLE